MPSPHRALSVAALAFLPLAAAAQEYQVGLAYTAVSTKYDYTGPGGAPPTYEPPGRSATAPSLFADVQAPIVPLFGFLLTGDLALRWPLGDDAGRIDVGAGISRRIARGYLALHYAMGSGVNGTGVLDDDWDFGVEGLRAIARRGSVRADVWRLTREDRTRFFGGDDVRTFSRIGASVRWKMLGAEIERWRDDLESANGGRTLRDLNRLSIYVAIGQHEGARGLW